MSPVATESVTEVVIVVAGLLVTGLIGAALVHWINREWREGGARQDHERAGAKPPDTRERAGESPAHQPPEN